MAESILAVVEKLTTLVIDESRLLKNVKGKVEDLKQQLRLIEDVVKDADAEQGGNQAYNQWLSQIREVGYQAVDVLETYRNDSDNPDFWSFKPIRLHKLNGEIDKIQSHLEKLYKSKDDFSIARNSNHSDEASQRQLRMWREPPAIMKEDDFIDLVEDSKELIGQLSDINHSVVSIIGMGGLGKTTLANKLYNHAMLHFDCKAFISVSKEYMRKEIMLRIFRGVCADQRVLDSVKELEEKELIVKLYSFLEKKKYLVVLDDIWKKKDWDNLKEAFPSGRGGKVMLTTRNREVAKHAGSIKPHEPRLMTEDESLELLGKRAVPKHADFTPEMKRLGVEMVKKCGGLPLAVVVLGGFLSGKGQEEWEVLYKNSKWRIMNEEEDRVPMILSLSYNFLPFHLKLCFQHLAIYPEDFCIPKNQLIRLWVAERFLPQQGEDDTEEDVAERCIYELINRSMVMVAERTSRGRVKAIRVHDVLRDFSISKAKESNFLEIYTGKENGPVASRSIQSRRLAIHGTYNNYGFLEQYKPHLRSLHFFSKVGRGKTIVYNNFKLLNVLEFEENDGGPGSDGLDCKVLSKLHQLRYLRFRGMTRISLAYGRLQWKNIQTLDFRECTFPSEFTHIFSDMIHLRHVLLKTGPSFSKFQELGNLIHLHTLKGVSSGGWVKDCLVKLIRLRRLGIFCRTREEAVLTINSVATLQQLRSFSLRVLYIPPFDGLVGCPHLQKLYLNGTIDKLPAARDFPPNLVKLVLTGTYLGQDSIAILEKLPNLQMLALNEISYWGREIVFSSEGFPRLEVLHVRSVNSSEWKIEKCALMKLKHLSVRDCQLLHVPDGIHFLTTLEELDMSASSFHSKVMSYGSYQLLVKFTKRHSIKFSSQNASIYW